MPFDVDAPAEELYRLAKISLKDRARLLKKAFETAEQLLEAEKTVFASYQGRLTDEKQVADLTARARAVEQAQSLAGLAQSKEATVNVQVNVVVPDWALQASPKPQSPKPKVIQPDRNNG